MINPAPRPLLVPRLRPSALATGAFLLTALSLFGADSVLLTDTFSDNERVTQALPNGARWLYAGAANPVAGLSADLRTNGQDLTLSSDGAGAGLGISYFTPAGSARTINDGASLELTFTVRFDSLRNLTSAFQFALFNSNSTASVVKRLTADSTSGSTFPSDGTLFANNIRGYAAQVNPGADSGAFNLFRRPATGNNTPFSGLSQLGAANNAALALKYQQAVPFSLKITRAGTALTVVASVNGVPVSRTDTNAVTFAYDAVCFQVNALALTPEEAVIIDDVVVNYTEAAVSTLLVNDTFADSNRNNDALPGSSRWFYAGAGSGTTRLISGVRPAFSRLTLTPGPADAAAVAYFTAINSPKTLAVGESLVLQATVSFETLRALEKGVRFGLFNSGGQRLAADSTGGIDPGAGSPYAGYLGYVVAVNPVGVGGFDLSRRSNVGTALFGGEALLGSSQSTDLKLGLYLPARFSLLITRTAAGLVLEASVNGLVLSQTDVAPEGFSFDTAAIFAAKDAFLSQAPLIFDDVLVLHRTAPVAIASPSTIASEPFTNPVWTAPTATATGAAVTAAASYANVGTIDNPGGVNPSGALLLSAQSAQTGPWSASLVTGVIPASNAETNLGKLTLAFDLQASATRTVRVRIESLDAADAVTGAREKLLYPAAPGAWQRYAFELADTVAAEGTFDPTAPRQRLRFAIDGGSLVGGWPTGAHTLKIDNLHYARPAYYVKPGAPTPTGPTAGRTEETAFPAIASALSAAQPGDIIVVMDSAAAVDFQLPAGLSFSRPGLPAGWVTLKNYPGQRPLIRSAENTFNCIGIGSGSAATPSLSASLAYLEVRGLRFQGTKATLPVAQRGTTAAVSNTNGISVDGRFNVNPPHHIRIADNEIFEFAAQGTGAIAGDFFYVENNDIHDNCNWTIYGTSGISTLRPWNFDGTAGTYRLMIVGNRTYRNETLYPWAAIGRISDGNGIIIDVSVAPPGGVYGRHGPYLGRTLVQNNVTYRNGGSGIHALESDGVDVFNNTAYLNSNSPALQYASIYGSSVNDMRVINNIIVSGPGEPLNTSRYTTLVPRTTGIIFRNNVYVAGGAAPYTEATSQDNVTVTDAGFVNAGANDFRLLPTSPAIDRGLVANVTPIIDYLGYPRGTDGIVDSGAYERQPIILTQPSSLAAVAGTGASLSVGAVGDNLTYQWRLNGADVSGATAATLTFPAITPAQAGTYRVVVSTGFDTATSADATVTVLSAQDGDGDGLTDPLEFALGSLANSPASAAAPTLGVNAGQLTLSFARARSEVTYLVQASDDLLTWTDLATNPGTVGANVTVTDVGSASPTRFLRLQVKLGTTTLNTVPVGRQKIALAAGATTAFGVALDDTTPPPAGIRAGKLEAFTANTLTNALGGWTAPLGTVAAPWALRLTSGPAAGKVLDVTANTATTLTVSGADLTTLGLTAGVDTFELIPLDTLGSLFGAATLQGGATAATADQVQVRSGSTWLVYYYDTTLGFWRRTIGPATASDNVRIRPETGVQVLRRGAALPLSFTGRVLATAFRPAVTNASTTVLHAGFPQATTLGALAVQNLLPGWRNGTTSAADQVFLYTGAAWVGHVFNGTNWQPLVGSATNSDALALPSSALITIQRPGATAGTTDLVRALPYSP